MLKSQKVGFFQLRLKDTKIQKLVLIGKKVKKICKKFNVKFIINDNPFLAKKLLPEIVKPKLLNPYM